MPAGAPSFEIVIPFEGPPKVFIATMDSDEEARLYDWVAAAGYDELIRRAYELAAEEPAA
jgi:hypothetical protein